MWSSFRVKNSSLNGVEMCEAQVSKYSLMCFNISVGVDLDTMALHVSDSGVSSEAHGMHVGICCDPKKFTKASLLVHEGAHSGSP